MFTSYPELQNELTNFLEDSEIISCEVNGVISFEVTKGGLQLKK